MATGAVIGALRVVIGADTAALDKGLKDAQGQLASFSRGIAQVAAGVGLERVVEKSISAIVEGIKHAITAADELGKAAQKVGLPVEELSALKFAAELADVSFETLTKSLVKFDKAQAAAGQGVKNDLAAGLEAMGIEIKNGDGSLKSQIQLLEEIADKFAGYEDGANKTALAVALFGKAGAELIPLLNGGAEGIRKAREEAQIYGLIVSKEAAAKSETFADDMKRLSVVASGLALVFTGELIDSLTQLSGGFVKATQDAERMAATKETLRSWAQSIGEQIKLATVEVPALIENLKRVGLAIFATATFQADAKDKWEENRKALLDDEAATAAVTAKYNEFAASADLLGVKLDGVTEKAKKTQAPFKAAGDSAKNALDSFLESTAKATAAQQAANATFGQSAGAQAQARIQFEAQAIAANDASIKLADYQAKITAAGNASAAAANQLQVKQLIEQSLTPFEQYQEKLRLIAELYPAAGAEAEKFAQVSQRAAEAQALAWEANIASNLGQLSQFASRVAGQNKVLGGLAKALGIGQAIINTQIAVTKALAEFGPTPFGFAAAGLAIATGAAAVATIVSQGFAQGGSFRIPGGTSLSDDQMVPLSLASGERVDISPASGGGATTVLNIDMRGDQPFYSRAVVEQLINAIHTVTLDGHNAQIVVVK